MRRKLTWDEILGILLFLLAACFLAVSVFLCFSDDIWYDELFTMGLAGQSFGELISVTARDVHPPLYYMIVKLFLMLFQALGICPASVPGGGLQVLAGAWLELSLPSPPHPANRDAARARASKRLMIFLAFIYIPP